VPNTAFKYYILKKISSQSEPVTVIDKVRTTNYQYPNSANFTWNIFPDTKVIAGFAGQKAETYAYGRKFTAWFTAEIPISDGPYTFRCLPGLILEICDTQKYFTFTLQEHRRLRQTNCLQLPPLRTRKLLATTRPKFREVEKAYREGTVARIMNGPFAAEVPASHLQQIREKIKKNNNTLERR